MLDIDVDVTAGKPLFGLLFGFARAFHVDLGRTLSRFGQNGDSIRQDLRESPRHCEPLFFATGTSTKSDFANRQFCDEWRMSGQNAQVTVLAGNLSFRDRR